MCVCVGGGIGSKEIETQKVKNEHFFNRLRDNVGIFNEQIVTSYTQKKDKNSYFCVCVAYISLTRRTTWPEMTGSFLKTGI